MKHPWFGLNIGLLLRQTDVIWQVPTGVFLAEVESRTQGSRPKPRTQKKSEAKAKDRNTRGQGPRTQAQVLSIKKKSSQKFFTRSPK